MLIDRTNYKGDLRSGRIRVEDVEKLRKNICIGDVITEEIWTDRLGERLVVPKRIRRKVIGIYPHLVEVEHRPGERRKTVTYAEILMRRMREAIKR